MLSEYREVEQRYYKLWIASSNVLTTLLNSAIVGRSREKLKDIHSESLRYVVTSSHQDALEKIEKMHTVIITGAPGVGKTYLADQLCQYHAVKGFQFVCVENSLNEAEAVYEKIKQIFYYDDFLGGNFLQALGHHQDSHIINFIKRIKKDNSKRFVLTTRTNIFNRGKHLSDKFGIAKVDKNEFILSINKLSYYEKAQILYNHLWHGNLDEEKVGELYSERRYLEVIEHTNFNPRLISFITDSDRLEDITSNDYWPYLECTLSNPKDVWRNVFDAQIDTMSRHVVAAVCCNDSKIYEENLETCFHRLDASTLGMDNSISFSAMMRILTGALLNRSTDFWGQPYYTLFNPSVADFVISNYLQSANYMDTITWSLQTVEVLDFTQSLAESKSINSKTAQQFFELQTSRLVKGEFGFELTPFVLHLVTLLIKHKKHQDKLGLLITQIIETQINLEWAGLGEDFYHVCQWCVEQRYIASNDEKLREYVTNAIKSEGNSHEELVALSKLTKAIDSDEGEIILAFTNELERVLSDTITDDIARDDVLADIYHSDEYDRSTIIEYIESSLEEFAISLSSDQVEFVADCFDEKLIIEGNRESAAHEDHRSVQHSETVSNNDSETAKIVDLFDRSDKGM